MENISECAHCSRQINLSKDAQTYCHECKKDFCFAMSSACFVDYHRKKNLSPREHSACCICDPTWKINLVVKRE